MSGSGVVFLFVVGGGRGLFRAQRAAPASATCGWAADDRTDEPFTRLKNVLTIGIAQTKIFRDPVAGAMHAVDLLGLHRADGRHGRDIHSGTCSRSSRTRCCCRSPLYSALRAVAGRVRACSCSSRSAFAFFRRLVLHPKRLEGDKLEHTDALIILGMIGGLMVTLLVANACTVLVDPSAHRAGEVRVARARDGAGADRCRTRRRSARSRGGRTRCSCSTFLNYLPYSKHLHVVTSLINVYLSNTSGPGQKGVMRPMDLEAETSSTSARRTSSSSRGRTCSTATRAPSAGAARRSCPANITGKLLSPRKIVINTRQRLMEKAPLVTGDRMEFVHHALVHGEGGDAGATTATQMLDGIACSTRTSPKKSCGRARAAVRACRSVRCRSTSSTIINELRRYLVLTESRFPEEMQPAFESLERNGSPWAFSPGDRARWADGHGHSDDGRAGRARRAARRAVLGRLHGFVRRSREEDHRRVRAESSRRAASTSRSSARKSTATAIRRAGWATSISIRCWPRTPSARSTATR